MKKNRNLKKHNLLAVFLIFSVALFFISHSAKAAKNQISNLSVTQNGDKLNLTFEINNFPKYRVFSTVKPDKLVIDFQDSEISSSIRFKENPMFKSARITNNSHSDLRIIILLNKKVQISKTTIINPVEGRKYKLSIDLDFNPKSSKKPAEKEIKYSLVTPLNNEIADKILGSEPDAEYEKSENKLIKNEIKKIKTKPVIIIDAGHGGKDPGTIGDHKKFREKDITLSYAKELKKYLDQSGRYNAFLTRDGDYFIPLRQRVEKSRKLKADLFISLHADSSSNNGTNGLSIYTLSEKSSDKQAEILAQKENKSDIIGGMNFAGTSSEIMNTLINMSQRSSMNDSAKFAEITIKTMRKQNIDILQNTHRFAGFRVLTAPDVAAVLIELGYLSNKSEERRLSSLEHRQNIAKSLLYSIDAYFGKNRK